MLDYNERINQGKEISVVEYLKRIDKDSEFMQKFKNQRHLRRGFFTEFKIYCFNYILLLFESVIRMLTTLNKEMEDEDGERIEGSRGRRKTGNKTEEQTHYFSKNYRRFLESRAKKID